MKKTLIISAGGTGGHLLPAQALAERLKLAGSAFEIHFVAGHLSKNPYFESGRWSFSEIETASLSLKKPWQLLSGAIKLLRGFCKSCKLIKTLHPCAVVGFGSFHTAPLLLAAQLLRIPIILHEANAFPGIVNRLFSAKALFTGIHFPQAAHALRGKCVLVGIPLRPRFDGLEWTKEEARRHFGLNPERLTLLVFGGSQGSMALNKLVPEALSMLPKEVQVLHFSGKSQETDPLAQAYAQMGISACVKPFEAQMEKAWRAADLVIGRAGASTLAEQMVMEVPGILIPYPFATLNHQTHNAKFLASTVQGGLFFEEHEVTPNLLASTLETLLWKDRERLEQMRKNLASYRKEQQDMAQLLLQFLK